MLTSFNMVIFLKVLSMISNFKLFPYFNISQNFVQNVQKQKKPLCPELVSYVLIKMAVEVKMCTSEKLCYLLYEATQTTQIAKMKIKHFPPDIMRLLILK